jgi:hypothetical protein
MFLFTILDHYVIYVVSIKYFFELATIMMIIPFLGSKNNGIPNYYIVNLFFAVIVYMCFLGFLQTEKLASVFEYDLFIYLRFFICILIGFQREFYTTIKKAMMIILFLGVIANVLSLFTSDTFIRSLIEEKTLTYKIQYILIPGFFYLFQFDKLNKNERRIVTAAVIVYALEQVLFQKRLPTLRVLITLLIYIYSIGLFGKSGINSRLILQRLFIFIFGIFFAIKLFALLGFNISEYFELLVKRFYIEDTVQDTIDEDERWKIGESFYEALSNSNEFFSGRGIGAVIYDNTFLMDDANGRPYRPAAEMGLPTMLLKGGVIFIGFFALIFIKFLQLYKVCRKNEYLFGAWVTVMVWFIFLYAEGFIGNILSMNEILLGYSIGLVLSSSSYNGHNFEPNESY